MKKLLLVSLFTFLIFAQITLAADFSVDAEVADKYLAGREEVINLTVTNNGPTEWFSISIIGLPGDWLNLETTSGLFRVESGETGTMRIFVKPGKDAIPLTYEYFINVKATSTNEVVEERILVPVKQITEVIIGDYELSCHECNTQLTVSGALYNIGTRDIPVTLTVTFGDDVRTLDIQELKIMEEEPFSYTFEVANIPPDTYYVESKVTSDYKTLYEDTSEFIIPVIQDIDVVEDSFTTPFGRFVSMHAVNKGNYKTDVEFKSVVNEDWYIIYAGPEGEAADGEYRWIVNIAPDEKYEFGYSEIYWPTYVVVVILIIAGFIMYMFYTAITIRKSIIGKNLVRAGKDMSVSIVIRNKIRDVTNLVVKDVIPEGFALVSKFATVKPTLRKTSGGTELVWKIGDLKPYEQRVLHYKMKPVKTFKGRKHLEKASLVAKYGEKTIKRASNLVSIYTKGEEPSVIPVEITK